MKKNLLSLSVVLMSLKLFSQGIDFEHGSWADVLAKANTLNKPVFVDVYTTWCGPCKMMSQNVFPLENVGTYFNRNFICCKIDAEKGDGIELAKTNQVNAYPTYLFLNPNGEMFYQSLGSMSSSQFIDVGKKALKEMNNPLNYSVLVKEYPVRKNDISFLQLYLKKRLVLELSNSMLLEEYLSLLSPSQQTADSTLELLCSNYNSISPGTHAFSILTDNKHRISVLGRELAQRYDNVIQMAINLKMNKAIKNKNETLVEETIKLYEPSLIDTYAGNHDQIWMSYFEGTKQQDKFVAYSIKYLDNTIMKLSMEEVKSKDATYYKNWKTAVSKEDSSGRDPKEWKTMVRSSKMYYSYQYANILNDIAWNFFETETDKESLTKALQWSQRSLDLTGQETYYLLDTYANLLYKLGNSPEAIKWETKAIEKGKANGEDISAYDETLQKMKKGEPTWSETN